MSTQAQLPPTVDPARSGPSAPDGPSAQALLARYPRLCAHLICQSLGYAAPTTAAVLLRQAMHGQPSGSEWILTCYQSDPRAAVRAAIENRHHHRGYLADFAQAVALVRQARDTGAEPHAGLASWF